MTEKKHIQYVIDQLSAKTDTLLAEKNQPRTPQQDQRCASLLDLWHQAERVSGEVEPDQEFFPRIDIATQIKIAEKEKLISSPTAEMLRDKFNASVTQAVGHELTDKQTKELYNLFRNFNPFDHS